MKVTKLKIGLAMIISLGIFTAGCSNNQESESTGSATEAAAPVENAAPVDDGKGIGPIKDLTIPASLDTALVAEGKAIFDMKCFACHNLDTRKVGPALQGVTERRKPEWVMNMIMNPGEMTQKDPTAKKLLGEYMTQMADQNVDEKSARALLEYFRSVDQKK